MKKIYLSLMLLGAVAFTSCDMNTTPWGALDENTAIQSTKDLRKFRNQLYTNLRSVTSGSWLLTTDIQMDEFNGVLDNGNQMGEISKGTFNTSSGEFSGFWGSCYGAISNCNAMIAQADKLLAAGEVSETTKVEIERYKGEALFFRGYMYFWLADHFCQSYTQTDPSKAASGMPLVTEYNPTGDVTKYPGRATLAETYKLIDDDLNASYSFIKAYEASGLTVETEERAGSIAFITPEAVQALQARIALVKGDWQTARDKAVSVIDCGKFKLATKKKYAKMWTEDNSTETILQPIQTPTELGGTYGDIFQDKTAQHAWYIPNYGALMMYPEGDIRFEVFFAQSSKFTVDGASCPAYLFNKYPGNPALRTASDNNFAHMSKVFRLSEMYLIAAEADGRLGKVEEGSKYLNDFCSQRIDGYRTQSYNATNLVQTALDERQREFIGEGMRWSDIRRLGKGFQRVSEFPSESGLDYLNDIMVVLGKNIKYDASDRRLTWPIPKAELDANPQIAGQQNPGYGN